MCKNTSVNVVVVTLQTTPTPLLGPSPRRVGLVLSASSLQSYSISQNPNIAPGQASYNFPTLSNGGWTETITEDTYGSAIKGPWYGAAANTVQVEVTEILEDAMTDGAGQPPQTTPQGDFQQRGMYPNPEQLMRERAGMSPRVRT